MLKTKLKGQRQWHWGREQKNTSYCLYLHQLWHFWLQTHSKGQRWLAVFPAVSSPSHTHTHTHIQIYIVAGTRALMLTGRPNTAVPRYVKGRPSLSREQERLNLNRQWGRNKKHTLTPFEQWSHTGWAELWSFSCRSVCVCRSVIHLPSNKFLVWLWQCVNLPACLCMYQSVCPHCNWIFKDCLTAWESSDEDLRACSRNSWHTAANIQIISAADNYSEMIYCHRETERAWERIQSKVNREAIKIHRGRRSN